MMKRISSIICLALMIFWLKTGWAHLALLGSVDGRVEGNVIHLTMSLPEEIKSSSLEATQGGLRHTIKFSNNGQPCQLDLKNVATAVPTVMTFDVLCDDPVRDLEMHSEYMVDAGYQFAVTIVEMADKGKPAYVLLDNNTEDAQFHFETVVQPEVSTNHISVRPLPGVDDPEEKSVALADTLRRFIGMGMGHIYTGYDHILFVLALILGSVALWPLIKTVTAFTIAHSITLILSTLNIVQLSPDIVEPIIAFSIAFVAFQDIINDHRKRNRPSVRTGSHWLAAFGFGLFHGLGFSGALKEINIPQSFLIPSLFSFNVGVEIAQITIIALVVPVLYFSKSFAWQRRFVHALLFIIGLPGTVWFVQRIGHVWPVTHP